MQTVHVSLWGCSDCMDAAACPNVTGVQGGQVSDPEHTGSAVHPHTETWAAYKQVQVALAA